MLLYICASLYYRGKHLTGLVTNYSACCTLKNIYVYKTQHTVKIKPVVQFSSVQFSKLYYPPRGQFVVQSAEQETTEMQTTKEHIIQSYDQMSNISA